MDVIEPLGSSPLTRGKLSGALTFIQGLMAHPRSRGENPVFSEAFASNVGSSPLTRGKPWADSAPG